MSRYPCAPRAYLDDPRSGTHGRKLQRWLLWILRSRGMSRTCSAAVSIIRLFRAHAYKLTTINSAGCGNQLFKSRLDKGDHAAFRSACTFPQNSCKLLCLLLEYPGILGFQTTLTPQGSGYRLCYRHVAWGSKAFVGINAYAKAHAFKVWLQGLGVQVIGV